MLLNNAYQRAQSIVGCSGIRKGGSHIGFEHYDNASGDVSRRVFIPRSATEIVFRKDFVGANRLRGIILSLRFLHNPFAHAFQPFVR
jgi:hypothetical protein